MCQILAPNGCHQSPENAIAIACYQNKTVIATICISWGNARQRTARRLTNQTRHAELRNQTLHHVENRLVQSDIDNLAFSAAHFALAQSHHDPNHPV